MLAKAPPKHNEFLAVPPDKRYPAAKTPFKQLESLTFKLPAVPVKPAPLPTKHVVAHTIGAQVQVVKLGLANGA